VYLSRYSTAFGVPLAVYGAIWFAGVVVLLAATLVGQQSVLESIPGYVFAMSTGALAVVLYLIYISFAVLKVYCVLCLVTDVAVVGLFIISGAVTSFPMTTLPRRAVRDLRAVITSPLAILIAVVFLGGAASAVALFPREGALEQAASSPVQEADRLAEFDRWFAAQPRVPIVVPVDAKVAIVDFSDFQCPFCKQAYETLKPILAKYNTKQPGAVKLVLKDFPLDSKCNSSVQGGGPHPSACEAAVAVRLARAKNRDVALEDWLFDNQPLMTSETVRKAAREIGQVTDFQEKYASTIALVKGDIDFGHSLNVKATPTLFINGVKVEGVLAPPFLERAIDLELQRATAK
jgi:protein-disulfide isomerase